jgi:hypothetical protein
MIGKMPRQSKRGQVRQQALRDEPVVTPSIELEPIKRTIRTVGGEGYIDADDGTYIRLIFRIASTDTQTIKALRVEDHALLAMIELPNQYLPELQGGHQLTIHEDPHVQSFIAWVKAEKWT